MEIVNVLKIFFHRTLYWTLYQTYLLSIHTFMVLRRDGFSSMACHTGVGIDFLVLRRAGCYAVILYTRKKQTCTLYIMNSAENFDFGVLNMVGRAMTGLLQNASRRA